MIVALDYVCLPHSSLRVPEASPCLHHDCVPRAAQIAPKLRTYGLVVGVVRAFMLPHYSYKYPAKA